MNKDAFTATRPSVARANRLASLKASLADDSGTQRMSVELTTAEHTKLRMHAFAHRKSVRSLISEYIATLPDLPTLGGTKPTP